MQQYKLSNLKEYLLQSYSGFLIIQANGPVLPHAGFWGILNLFFG